jgi:hypothetical protein
VDGHRSTAFIISPYTKRGVVNHTYNTQVNLTCSCFRELSVAVRRLQPVALGNPVVPVANGFFG